MPATAWLTDGGYRRSSPWTCRHHHHITNHRLHHHHIILHHHVNYSHTITTHSYSTLYNSPNHRHHLPPAPHRTISLQIFAITYRHTITTTTPVHHHHLHTIQCHPTNAHHHIPTTTTTTTTAKQGCVQQSSAASAAVLV